MRQNGQNQTNVANFPALGASGPCNKINGIITRDTWSVVQIPNQIWKEQWMAIKMSYSKTKSEEI